jgi:dienelactone hydrolase
MRRVLYPAIVGILVTGQALAQPVAPADHCRGWDQLSDVICVKWPDPAKFRPPVKAIAIVPGCDGFDGSGYDGDFNVPNEGNKKDSKEKLAARVKHYKRALIGRYEEQTRGFLADGFAVMKVDYTRASSSGPVPQVTKCKDAVLPTVLGNVAARLGYAISLLRSTHSNRVARDQIYVVGSSLGGGGVLRMFEKWNEYPEHQRPDRAVLYFPACKTDLGPWEAKIPTLMLLGSLDNVPVGHSLDGGKITIFPLAPECRRQAARAGAKLDFREYPGAFHAFNVKGPQDQIEAVIVGAHRFVTYRRDDKAAAAAAKASRKALK